jgi:D-alanine-D-alanine ligase
MIMSIKSNSLKVAVVMGGKSSERAISLNTGKQCSLALDELGYTVVEIDAKVDIVQSLCLVKPDIIFNALHGRWGEDGVIQGCFEWLGIPYTHSGVLASALAMNKQKAREIFQLNGLPIAKGFILDSKKLLDGHPMSLPYVIKPNNEGSSVGVNIISKKSEDLSILKDQLPTSILVEEFIPGRELTVTIMNEKPLAVTEIVSPVWYNYDAKYQAGGSKHIIPALVPKEIRNACFDYALTAHKALGCRGVTRVDFRWNDKERASGLIILEINTQPGMTVTSLVPEQANACGVSFQELCKWIVEDASCLR